MARMHAHHLARTARLSAVTGLGAAVLVSAFALPATAEPVNAVQRGPTKIVAAQTDQKRKKVTVKQGDSLSKIAKKAKLSSWRPIWDLNKKIHHPNLIYPGQKLLIPAKGEKVKHRPLPALAVTRVVSQERPRRPRRPAPGARPLPGRPRRRPAAASGTAWPSASPAATGASTPATATPAASSSPRAPGVPTAAAARPTTPAAPSRSASPSASGPPRAGAPGPPARQARPR